MIGTLKAMKLWRRTAGALKDGNSLIAAEDCLTIAVVKATSHDELSMDSGNAEFIYRYVRTSPSSLRPLAGIISSRAGRTRSWAVALKGLMLIHGFFLRKVPAAESIGRLPFDLSGFGVTRSLLSRSCGFNLFVRAYFVFLDQRSILFHDVNLLDEESSVMIQLTIIRKMQNLVDSLMRIKPIAENMSTPLINEAMDNVIIEILEIYGRICVGIAEALPKVHSKTGKPEAKMALKIVTKSIKQGEDLCRYFEFCKDFGIPNTHEIPDFVRIPEADVMVLEKLVHGAPAAVRKEKDEQPKMETSTSMAPEIEEGEERGRGRNPDLIEMDHDEPGNVSATRDEIPDLIRL
ncbi:PREDICTED: putative clathrin assembly protein At1g14686 [Tarenaya hassleriana]|uniref:putative clathrin assembly protein At1g14686 n=1 Tax=Tarenaya hassleriana TaxID=28532 RepID=UPI00053C11DF|nr:PREDICTED: putative clathrin assembly protein At1g14686 [Tarenaya hassleriana]